MQEIGIGTTPLAKLVIEHSKESVQEMRANVCCFAETRDSILVAAEVEAVINVFV